MKHLIHTLKLRFFFLGWMLAIFIDQRNGRDTGGEPIEPSPSVPRDVGLLYAGLTGGCLVSLLWIASEVLR